MKKADQIHKIEALLARLFLIGASLLGTLLMLEMGTRFFMPQDIPEFQNGLVDSIDPKPYLVYTTSNNSFRSPGSAKINKDDFKIFIYGGSTVEFGSPPLPLQIELLFRQAGHKNIKVINKGVTSSVSGQNLARLIFEDNSYGPDLVMFYGGGNDILNPDPRPGYPHFYSAFEFNPVLTKKIEDYPLFPLISYSSQLARQLFPFYFEKKFRKLDQIYKAYYSDKSFNQQMEQVFQVYLQNLEKSWRYTRGGQIPFIGILQPLLAFKEHKVGREMEVLIGDQLPKYPGIIKRQLASQILPFEFHDLSLEFQLDKEQRFTDGIHLTTESNQQMAKKLYQILLPHVKKRFKKAENQVH